MKVGDFTLVSEAGEQNDLLRVRAFNDTRTAYPRYQTVHALFQQQAAARPDAIAVINDSRSCTYRELDAASNRLARVLIDKGVARE